MIYLHKQTCAPSLSGRVSRTYNMSFEACPSGMSEGWPSGFVLHHVTKEPRAYTRQNKRRHILKVMLKLRLYVLREYSRLQESRRRQRCPRRVSARLASYLHATCMRHPLSLITGRGMHKVVRAVGMSQHESNGMRSFELFEN